MLPIEAIIHKRMLKMLQNIASDSESMIYEIALHQVGTEEIKYHSWLNHTVVTCAKYDLPSPHKILQMQPKR